MRDELSFAPHLTRFSRDALYLVFSAFGAMPATPVWCPSFHCGMEVRAAAEAGFMPRFYRLREDLTIDEQHLAECLDDAAGPVLLIHYFGFAQPGTERIAALCRAKGVPLIEDCSHAFLSRSNGRPCCFARSERILLPTVPAASACSSSAWSRRSSSGSWP